MSIEITNWLRGLGLEQFATAFLANDIDAEILPKLTADDLIGLGVTSIGHRRKLLDAIAMLRDGLANFQCVDPVDQGATGRRCLHRCQPRRASAAHCHVLRSGRLNRAGLSP